MPIKKLTLKNKLIISIVSVVMCVSLLTGLLVGLLPRKKNNEIITKEPCASTGASVADSSQKGGAVLIEANTTYTMSGGSITGSSNTYGGAIYVEDGGNLIIGYQPSNDLKTLTPVTGDIVKFTNNTSTCGGGIYFEGTSGTISIDNVLFDSCKAENYLEDSNWYVGLRGDDVVVSHISAIGLSVIIGGLTIAVGKLCEFFDVIDTYKSIVATPFIGCLNLTIYYQAEKITQMKCYVIMIKGNM